MEEKKLLIGNKIIEIQDYFINKVKNGDYKVLKVKEHTATIEIDDTYQFDMWIASGKNHYDFCERTFLTIKNFSITMKGLQSRGWIYMKKHLNSEIAKKKRREKMKQFNRLKKELNIKCE